MSNASRPANDNNELAKVAALAVTTTGRSPSAATWEYTVDQLEDDIMNLVKSLVPAIQNVTIEASTHTGAVMAFAWLPANSEHLVDNQMKGMIGKPIQSYSKEVKEILEKYAPKDTKNVISPQKGTGNNLAGIPLDLRRVLGVLMDESGTYCKNTYGTSVKSRLELRAIFREGNDKEKRLLGIAVTKNTTVNTHRRPKPNPNFRY